MKKISGHILCILFLFLVSCGNNANQKEQADNTSSDQTTTGKTTTKNILFFGNSLTAGYGLDEPSQSFAGLIQKKIDSLDLPYRVINGGVSGETTAGGLGRIDFVLKQQPVHVFVLELGANDGLRGVSLEQTRKNLQGIVDRVKAKYPEAKLVLAGMQIPPNMGADYANDFRDIFPEVAQKNNMTLIPFLLEGVGGEAKYNQRDGIHPTAEGHQIVAENVWRELKKIL